MNEKKWTVGSNWVAVHDDPPTDPPGDGGDSGIKLDDKQQKFVNDLISKEKKAYEGKLKRAIDEVNALKTKSTLTQQERDELDKRMTQLNETMLTKEELHKKQVDELQESLKNETTRLSKERDAWQQRFTGHLIKSTIVDEAARAKAYNPNQLVAILNPQTTLIEELEGGKPTGTLVPVVKFNDKDKDGKPVSLQLSVPDAVKRMTKLPEFANLFNQGGVGGMGAGGAGGQGGGDKSTLSTVATDPAAYRTARKQGMKL